MGEGRVMTTGSGELRGGLGKYRCPHIYLETGSGCAECFELYLFISALPKVVPYHLPSILSTVCIYSFCFSGKGQCF